MYRRMVLVLLASSTLLAQPCQDYTCDSMVVRAILDSNGLSATPVDSVADTAGGRIISLDMSGQGIQALPDVLCQLSALQMFYLRFNEVRALPLCIVGMEFTIDVFRNKLCDVPDTVGHWLTAHQYCSGFCLHWSVTQDCQTSVNQCASGRTRPARQGSQPYEQHDRFFDLHGRLMSTRMAELPASVVVERQPSAIGTLRRVWVGR